MLMFNYGILATFIPELVMVIGFLLSIIVPNLNNKPNATTENQQTIYVHSSEQNELATTYVASAFDFQQAIQQEELNNVPVHFPTIKSSLAGSDPDLIVSDGLSFIQFSRPPPFIS